MEWITTRAVALENLRQYGIYVDPPIEAAEQNRDPLYKAAISLRRRSKIDQTRRG